MTTRGRGRPVDGPLVLRWGARIWSVASIGLIVAFVIGEGLGPMRPAEMLCFLFFPIGISAGMTLAWWRERLGGSITVGSLLAFYVACFATSGGFPRGWAWLAFTAPGFLFLLAGMLADRSAGTR